MTQIYLARVKNIKVELEKWIEVKTNPIGPGFLWGSGILLLAWLVFLFMLWSICKEMPWVVDPTSPRCCHPFH